MTTPHLTQAADFIWRTARLLDRHRFAFHFLAADSQPVVEALRPYQNLDGGFGNALEPDLRSPDSQPVPTLTALGMLDEIARMDATLLARICAYLPTITTSEGGVPFVLSSAHAYPRAPWWEPEDPPVASLNPTASIAALFYKHSVEDPWLVSATAYCWRKLAILEETSPYEMRAILPFLDAVPDRTRAEEVFARVGPKILEQKLVALEPTTQEDTHTPLHYAPHPQSLARGLFSTEVIEAHLDALAASQQEDGGWPVNWYSWSPAVTLEWRGVVTIEALLTLRAYGRLA